MPYNLKGLITEGTKYVSGYVNEDDDYTISASMVANDPLQNYLSIVHGKGTEDEITDATLGSVFHLGMEQLVREKMDTDVAIIGAEVAMHHKLSNGWVLSGTADLIVEPEVGRFEIHDYKLTKKYTRKMTEKDLYTSGYTKQLQVLDALFRRDTTANQGKEINRDIELHCDFFLKDTIAVNFESVFQPLVIPNKVGTSEMNAADVLFAEVVEITNSLQSYIEAGTIPPVCKDRWPRNVKGTVIPSRCEFYCGHKNVCPHYSPDPRKVADRLANW